MLQNGPDKYRRFARMVATQEQELAAKLAVSQEKREKLEADVKTAREKLAPTARKKRTTTRKKTNSRAKSVVTKKIEEKILKETGTREEQIERLPKNNG